MIDLEEILRVASDYDGRKEAARKLETENFGGATEERVRYLASLKSGEAAKAFEALRPLVERVRELERQRDWLVKYYSKLENPGPCPYLEGAFDQTKPCPFWVSDSGEMPEENSLEAWKKLLLAPVEYGDEYLDCGTSLNVCLKFAAEEAAKEAGE